MYVCVSLKLIRKHTAHAIIYTVIFKSALCESHTWKKINKLTNNQINNYIMNYDNQILSIMLPLHTCNNNKNHKFSIN